MTELIHRAANAALILIVLATAMLFFSCKEENHSSTPKPAEQAAEKTKPPSLEPVSANPAVAPSDQGEPGEAAGSTAEPASLALVYTTAISGELIDCGCPGHPRGGLARRAAQVSTLRQAGKPVIQVDAGNGLFADRGPNSPITDQMKAEAKVITRTASYLQVDAIAVGELDLMAGLDFFKQLVSPPEGTPLPVVSVNLYDRETDKRVFEPYITVNKGGARITIIGVTDPKANSLPGVTVKDPTDDVAKLALSLASRSDLIVVLYSGDFTAAARLAREVPKLDIVISGDRRSGPKMRPLVVGDTLVAGAGNRGMYLGVMDLELKAEGKKVDEAERVRLREELARLEAQERVLTGEALQDAEIRGLYNQTRERIQQLRDQIDSMFSRLDYQNRMISMDMDLPEDPEVAGWVAEVKKP